MILQTQRLILRKFTENDLDALATILGNEEVMRFSLKGAMNRDEVQDYLKKRILSQYDKLGYGLYAIILKENQSMIGFIGFLSQNIDGEDKIELGYRLSPQYWGKGYAIEAAKEICHYAFDKLQINELISIIDPKNARSISLANRLGMHYWKDASFHGFLVKIYSLKKLTVVPYNHDWPKSYNEEIKKLKEAFKDIDIQFYHIGSTSIPGCYAKPIIDILGVTSDLTLIEKYNNALSNLGYTAMGEYGIKQRRYFRRKHTNPVNLHIFEKGNSEIERHLRFCGFLRAHPEKVKEYSRLKMELAAKYPGDHDQYCSSKEMFIKEIDRLAACF